MRRLYEGSCSISCRKRCDAKLEFSALHCPGRMAQFVTHLDCLERISSCVVVILAVVKYVEPQEPVYDQFFHIRYVHHATQMHCLRVWHALCHHT